MYFLFLLLLLPKCRSIYLCVSVRTPRHRDGSDLTQGYTAQIIMTRVTHEFCEEQQKKMLPSILSWTTTMALFFKSILWSPNTLVISDMQNKQRLVQTDFWCYRHWSPCKRRNLRCHWLKIPQVTVKILQTEADAYCGCFSWPWGHMQGNNWWESKGEKNSYFSGALTEGIGMWGHLGLPQNRKPETSLYPLVLHFPPCGSCSPLSPPSPSLPGDSGRRGQGE